MSNPIYRITVEVIGEEDQNHQISKTLKLPIECNGFVIIGDRSETEQSLSVHNMSVDDIAEGIRQSGVMIAAGVLAKAREESIEIIRKERSLESFKKLLNL